MKTDRTNIVENQVAFNLAIADLFNERYNKSLDLEGDAIIKRSVIRVKRQKIDRMKPKDDKTIKLKIESEKRLVKSRSKDDWWKALLQMCKSCGTTLTVIQSPTRVREIVEVRHCIWFISMHYHNTTLKELGRFFHNHHTTVLHGLRNISKLKSGKHPDMRIMNTMNKLLTGLIDQGMIVSKEYYMKKEYL